MSDHRRDLPPPEELDGTDALLDRLGARRPEPGDLDDPVLAALALLAAEVDLAPAAAPDLHRWDDAPGPAPADLPAPELLDVDDVPVPRVPMPSGPPPLSPANGLPLLHGISLADLTSVVESAEPAAAPTASAGRPAAPRAVRGRQPVPLTVRAPLRPLLTAAALVAVLGGGGLSGVVTGGQSYDPVTGLSRVLAGYTTPQLRAKLDEASRLAVTDPRDAAAVLATVADAIGVVPPADRAELTDRVTRIADRLPAAARSVVLRHVPAADLPAAELPAVTGGVAPTATGGEQPGGPSTGTTEGATGGATGVATGTGSGGAPAPTASSPSSNGPAPTLTPPATPPTTPGGASSSVSSTVPPASSDPTSSPPDPASTSSSPAPSDVATSSAPSSSGPPDSATPTDSPSPGASPAQELVGPQVSPGPS